MKILLAEDNKIASRWIKETLESMGHEVDLAEDGGQAIDKLGLGHRSVPKIDDYALILLDLSMPRVNGMTVCREIRQYERSKKLLNPAACLSNFKNKIIICISSNAKEFETQCLDSGFNDVSEKPKNINDIQKIIDRWIP